MAGQENNICRVGGKILVAANGPDASFYNDLSFYGMIYNQDELAAIAGRAAENNAQLVYELIFKLGLEEALKRIDGVFALSYFDGRDLILAHDHFGVCPLFYAEIKGELVFATQLQAITGCPGFVKIVNSEALSAYIRYNWVPANLCIFESVNKLKPGHYVRISAAKAATQTIFYDPVQVALSAQESRFSQSDEKIIEELLALLRRMVDTRLSDEAARGLLLSGGIDSSLLAILLKERGPVNSYTIGFPQASFSEAHYAADTARLNGFNHHQATLDGEKALDILPQLLNVYEEPYADQSQIPTMAAMQLARPHNHILWLGDAGDEFFLGYPRHLSHAKYYLPHSSQTGKCSKLTHMAHPWRTFLALLGQPVRYIQRHQTNPEYSELLLNWRTPNLEMEAFNHIYDIDNPSRQAGLFDVLLLLTGSGVIKSSRLAASLSMGLRTPLLSYKLFNFAQRLPMRLLAAEGKGKIVFRKILENYYPPEWINRPKSGFGAPVGQWLQKEFKPWADDLLSEEEINRQGYFSMAQIKLYRSQLGRRGSATNKLWAILMFQTWARREGL